MTFIGIGSPIPELPTLPGQTGPAVEVTLDYPSSSACKSVTSLSPAEATPAGGAFSSTAGLTINSSTGVVNPSTSTAGVYTISYTVSGVVSQFALTIIAVQSAAFSYSGSSFPTSGTTSPTITGNTGGTFTSNASPASNLSLNGSTGEINLATSTIGNYIVTYTNSGTCPGTPQTDAIELVAPYDSLSSFSFDGSNDYFDIGNPTELQLTNNISVSGWFKTSSSSIMNMFTKRATGVNNWSVYMQSGKIYFWVSVDGSSVPVQIISATTLNDDEWHFFAGVREGASLKLYIDDLTAVTGAIASGSLTNPNGTVMIGKASVNNFLWNGNIDELAIWDTNLSSDAVTEIYNSGVPNDLTSLSNASSSNLKAWYKM